MILIYLQRKRVDGFLTSYYPSAQEREQFCLPFKTLPLMEFTVHSIGFAIFALFLYACITDRRSEGVLIMGFVIFFDIMFIIHFICKRVLSGAAVIDKRICIWKNVFKAPNKDVPLDTIEKVFIYQNPNHRDFTIQLDISCIDGKKYNFSEVSNIKEIHNRLRLEKSTNNYSMRIFPESIDELTPSFKDWLTGNK